MAHSIARLSGGPCQRGNAENVRHLSPPLARLKLTALNSPAYDAAAAHFVDNARLFKLNSDDNQPAAAGLGIRGVPTLIAYNGGRQVAHQSGAQTGAALNRWIESAMSAA